MILYSDFRSRKDLTVEYPLAWIVPIAVTALYVAWGLGYQARNPEAGGER